MSILTQTKPPIVSRTSNRVSAKEMQAHSRIQKCATNVVNYTEALASQYSCVNTIR